MTTFFQKIGLVAKDSLDKTEAEVKVVAIKVEQAVGIVSAATKESLKSLVPTKEYTMTVQTGFNGEKFYALAPDGSTVKEFDTYDELVAYVQPVQEAVVVAVVAPEVQHTPLEDAEAAAQAEIDAATAKLAALKAQE